MLSSLRFSCVSAIFETYCVSSVFLFHFIAQLPGVRKIANFSFVLFHSCTFSRLLFLSVIIFNFIVHLVRAPILLFFYLTSCIPAIFTPTCLRFSNLVSFHALLNSSLQYCLFFSYCCFLAHLDTYCVSICNLVPSLSSLLLAISY